MPDQLSVEEFAGKVKSRFPQFAEMDDADLTRKILERRPELISQVQTSEKRPAVKRDDMSHAEGVVQGLKNVGKNLTVGLYEQSKVRAGEGVPPEAVGVPMPGAFVKNSIDDFLDGMQRGYEARQQARQQGEGIPGQILATAEQYPMIGAAMQKEEQSLTPKDLNKPWYQPVLTPEALQGSTEMAGYAAAPEALKKTGGAIVKGATKVIEKGPDLVRHGAQIVAGVTPERTTAPLVDEFKAKATDAATKQAEEVASTDTANRAAVEKFQTAKRDAFQQGEAQQAEHTLKTEETQQANAKEQARADEANRVAQETETRRNQLDRNLQQGSKQFGEGVKELARRVKEEKIDPQYAEIAKAVEKDPGEPSGEIANEVNEAIKKNVKGSPEKIKQVTDLMRQRESDSGLIQATPEGERSVMYGPSGSQIPITAASHPEAWQQMVDRGIIPETPNVAYDKLSGYSTEIGNLLRAGVRDGDMYNALKAVQEVFEKHKQMIADRNGVGSKLTTANADYGYYKDTFEDKGSAIADVHDRVGRLDPEFYAEPIISGKSAKTGLSKLRGYAKDFPAAQQLTDLAGYLRDAKIEHEGLPRSTKEQTPTLKGEPEPLSPIEQPQKPQLKAPKAIEQPTAPTAEDVRARKTEEIKRSAKEIGHLSKYDAGVIASSAIGPFFGHWSTLLIDPAFVVARKAIGRTLERPAVVKWLAEPTPADLEILRKVPDRVRSDVQNNIKDFITEERAAGRPIKLAGAVSKFLTGSAAESDKKKPNDLKNEGARLTQ